MIEVLCPIILQGTMTFWLAPLEKKTWNCWNWSMLIRSCTELDSSIGRTHGLQSIVLFLVKEDISLLYCLCCFVLIWFFLQNLSILSSNQNSRKNPPFLHIFHKFLPYIKIPRIEWSIIVPLAWYCFFFFVFIKTTWKWVAFAKAFLCSLNLSYLPGNMVYRA